MRIAEGLSRVLVVVVLAGAGAACGSAHATGALGKWQDFDAHLESSADELAGLLGSPSASSLPDTDKLQAWVDGEITWLHDNKSDPCYSSVYQTWFYSVTGLGTVLSRPKTGTSARMLASTLDLMRDRIDQVKSDSDKARDVCAGAAPPASATGSAASTDTAGP